ncbi:MAG: GNAT family N-acetyltransferase [Oscillospiraceae bacterium]|nr:GNAT family N-acetyltransferase [Oscillospiraceae bacterium]
MVEENELKKLWHAVFGDDRAYIDAWFRAFFRPEVTAVIRDGNDIAAMAFVLPLGTLHGAPCASLYAVASAPEKRGLGLGKAVTRSAAALAERAGFAHVLLRPADRSLFRFYEKLGFSPVCPARKTACRLTGSGPAAVPCGPDRYLEVRDTLPDAVGAVCPSADLLSFFSSAGGRLYAGEGFCAAVENEDGKAMFRELLTGGKSPEPDALSSMAYGATEAVILQPCSWSAGVPCAMRYGSLPEEDLRWPSLMLD